MSLLIDSHALLWWLTDDRRLGDKARSRMTSSPRAMVSVAVAWELGIKEAKGRIRLPDAFDRRVIDAGFEWLPIDIDHVAALRDLPAHHADPFDRIMSLKRVRSTSRWSVRTERSLDTRSMWSAPRADPMIDAGDSAGEG